MTQFSFILSIALGQGLLLAFFLLSSKYYRSAANTCLALTLILLSTITLSDIWGSEYVTTSPLVEFFFHDLELDFLVYVPLLYFFNISTSPASKWTFNPWLLLPFLLDTLVNIYIFRTYPVETIADNRGVQLFYEIESYAAIGYALYLSYRSYRLIEAANTEAPQKRWILKIWRSTVVLLIAWVLMMIFGYAADSVFPTLVLALYILISVWMFWLIYNGIVNLKLIKDRKEISQKIADKAIPRQVFMTMTAPIVSQPEPAPFKSQQPPTKPNPALFDSHFLKINELVLSESLYRNENLGIEDLAGRMEMSTGYVSKIIKSALDKSFPLWINELRVAEVKAMFEEGDYHHYTTLSIGLEAGFKSKSAFYAAFKKITGESPAKFRKKKS